MSTRKIVTTFVVCDGCGRDSKPGEGALAARIKAAVDGWSHASIGSGSGRGQNAKGQRDFDWCPTCPDPRPRAGQAAGGVPR